MPQGWVKNIGPRTAAGLGYGAGSRFAVTQNRSLGEVVGVWGRESVLVWVAERVRAYPRWKVSGPGLGVYRSI